MPRKRKPQTSLYAKGEAALMAFWAAKQAQREGTGSARATAQARRGCAKAIGKYQQSQQKVSA